MVMVVPSSIRLCTCISPPCMPTRPFTMDRPRPVPSWRALIGLAGLEERIADPRRDPPRRCRRRYR